MRGITPRGSNFAQGRGIIYGSRDDLCVDALDHSGQAPCPGRTRAHGRSHAFRAWTDSDPADSASGPGGTGHRGCGPASVSTATSTLFNTVICGTPISTEASFSFRRSAAGFIRLEWNGCRDRQQGTLGPCGFEDLASLGHAILAAGNHRLLGVIEVDRPTTSRHSPGRPSGSADAPLQRPCPGMAAMPPVPTGTASCMAWARRRTSGRGINGVSTPAATSAEYSPSE